MAATANKIATKSALKTSSRSSTEIKFRRSSHIWSIKNFSFCREETGKAFPSTKFCGDDGHEWQLLIYPNGKTDNDKDYVSIDLAKLSIGGSIEGRLRFSLINASQEPCCFSEYRYVKFNSDGTARGFPGFINKEYLFRRKATLLPDDTLTLFCEIEIRGNRIDSPTPFNAISTSASSFQNPASSISADLKTMFDSQKFGDVIVKSEDKEFRVYSGILQARSPVFAAMFTHPMKEQKQNRVVIEDVKSEVVEEMLTFIHSEKAPNVQVMANDLLAVADKYDLKKLKVMCEMVLAAKVTKQNMIDTLILADLYSADQLKSRILNLISANSSHFLAKSTWENTVNLLVEADRPELIAEISKILSTTSNK